MYTRFLFGMTVIGMAGGGAPAAEVAILPIRSSGQYNILNGNEIYLASGGQRVFFEFNASGWDPDLDGTPRIKTLQVRVDSSTYTNAMSPRGFTPAFVECPSTDAMGRAFCEMTFGETGTKCLPAAEVGGCPFGRCCEALFVNRTRPDWILYELEPNVNVAWDDSTWNYRVGWVTFSPGAVTDNGTVRYAGTMALDVPNDALGDFVIGIVEAESFIFDDATPLANRIPITSVVTPIVHLAIPDTLPKNRYLSVVPGDPGVMTAIRVTMDSLHHPDPFPSASPYPPVDFLAFEGQTRWLGPPQQFLETVGPQSFFTAAPIQCEPYFMYWGTLGAVHVYGAEVIPSSSYTLEQVDVSCNDLNDPGCYTLLATRQTAHWADVVSPFNVPGGPAQPDFSDITALVDKYRQVQGSPVMARVVLYDNVPKQDVDSRDFTMAVNAFRGYAYPFPGPVECP